MCIHFSKLLPLLSLKHYPIFQGQKVYQKVLPVRPWAEPFMEDGAVQSLLPCTPSWTPPRATQRPL